jgi:hypothetical protein
VIEAEGRYLRYTKGRSHAARVWLKLECNACQPAITTACQGWGWGTSQGDMDDASAEGFEDWKSAAEAGVRYALRIAGVMQANVIITRILGRSFTDTTPTIVAAAAADALWTALSFTPPTEAVGFLAQQAFQSWDLPGSHTFVPNW